MRHFENNFVLKQPHICGIKYVVVILIIEVVLRRARLAPIWVTIFVRINMQLIRHLT